MKTIVVSDEDYDQIIAALEYASNDLYERAHYEASTGGSEEAEFKIAAEAYGATESRVIASAN
jgi:hypothetical protein